MKKTETLFIGIGLFAVIIVTGGALWRAQYPTTSPASYNHQTNKYGAFLAAQHALYVNDFDKASLFSAQIPDKDIPIVQSTGLLSDFLSGKMPASAQTLKDDKGAPAQLIYDAYLLDAGDWESVYARHKNDKSALAAPLRIWSTVAIGKTPEALKFIDELNTNDSWKAFVRGQIFAETGKIDDATKEFTKVSVDFMNINDYLYIFAFYTNNGLKDAAGKLRADFTERPGGMFMLDYEITPDWSEYAGLRNALAFSLIQNVSHTQVMMYSDLSLLLLRFAEIIQEPTDQNKDAINYYLGQYFHNNGGNYEVYFKTINKNSPFYSFALMRMAEKSGKTDDLKKAVRDNPLFVPAALKLIAQNVQQGDKRDALRIVNRAMKDANLTETGRAFFLKTRAQIYLTFNDLDAAQTDIRSAADILPVDAGILAIQSRIWSTQMRELDTAYEYAIALVQKNPAEIEAWDILGLAVAAREGPTAALEVLERVGEVSTSYSALFEHLGDLYIAVGNEKLAKDAYLRALDLSADGLTIVPDLEKKIRKLK